MLLLPAAVPVVYRALVVRGRDETGPPHQTHGIEGACQSPRRQRGLVDSQGWSEIILARNQRLRSRLGIV